MSEIDRLSNTGSFPALPITAKRRLKDDSGQPSDPAPPVAEENESTADTLEIPRLPKSIIDEYA